MLGMFFAATMWRVRAMTYVSIYFAAVALYFAFKSALPGVSGA